MTTDNYLEITIIGGTTERIKINGTAVASRDAFILHVLQSVAARELSPEAALRLINLVVPGPDK